MTPRVAVTGASGFCGGAVLSSLRADGFDVVSVGRSRPRILECEHRDMVLGEPLAAGLLADVDLVVHAAALATDRGPRDAFMRANVRGTRLLAEAGVPMVFLSSASVYDGGPVPRREEDTAPRPGSWYGRSKLEAEQCVLGHGGVVLRPRAVYGPGDTQLLPRILAGVRRNRLVVPGGDVPMSLASITLLTAAVRAAMNAGPGTVWNVADSVVYGRDRVLRAVLGRHAPGATLRHVPTALARVVGAIAERSSYPLSRYAVDQLANPVVLDTSRLRASGLSVELCAGDLAGFLDTVDDLGFSVPVR